MKQRFVELIRKVSKPLTDLIEKNMKPLEAILRKIADAAELAFIELTKPLGEDETILSRLVDSVKVFWDDLTSDSQMNQFAESFKKTMATVGQWLGKNVLAPAIAFAWNDIIDAIGLPFMQKLKISKIGDLTIDRRAAVAQERLDKLDVLRGSVGTTFELTEAQRGVFMEQAIKSGMEAALRELYQNDVFVANLIRVARTANDQSEFTQRMADLGGELPEALNEFTELNAFYDVYTSAQALGMDTTGFNAVGPQ